MFFMRLSIVAARNWSVKMRSQKALARSFVRRLNKRQTIALCRCSELLNGNLIERRVRMLSTGTGALPDTLWVCV